MSAPSSTNSSAAGSSPLSSGPSEGQAKTNASVNVKIDGKKVNAEVKLLSEEINKTDWEEADNHVIETGMKSIEPWRNRMKICRDLVFNIEKNTLQYGLDAAEHVAAE